MDGLCIRFWATGTNPHAYLELYGDPHEGSDWWWMDTPLRVEEGAAIARTYDVARINRNGVVIATSTATVTRLQSGCLALRGLAGFTPTDN